MKQAVMGYMTEVLANEILESIFMNDFNVSGYIHVNVYQHPFEASVVSQSVSQSGWIHYLYSQ